MKRFTLLMALFIFFACEDKDDDNSGMIGTWELTNMGEYANADCSGAVDDSGWALVQAFGMKITLELKSGGTGTYTMKMGPEEEGIPVTWDESKSQICMMGIECTTFKLSGDSFTLDTPDEAFCEDDDGDETNHSSQATCEAAGNIWHEASCSVMTFTKD